MSSIQLDDHSRTIIHIDIDCFYAQVETNKNPSLTDLPLGIQQKNIVVTCNYKAREFGIKKCMLLTEAKKACPNLVLVNGEDLHDYRQISYQITTLLQNYSPNVERLGLDENFIDITKLVAEKFLKTTNETPFGHTFGDLSDKCDCGCYDRLTIGSQIAHEIRNHIKTSLNLTTCAGIAHNKLLAKIAGAKHKPNQQTTVFPNNALELMRSLASIRQIPGIGSVTGEQLERIGIKTVEDCQNSQLESLVGLLGAEKANLVRNWAFGVDSSIVKKTGKPQSIGLEDSCKTVSADKEVRDKLHQLLVRLLQLVKEDGRVPKTIKLTVRKFDKAARVSHRETRQCNINPGLFAAQNSSNEAKIMSTIMHLFSRIVDAKKPYHVTLFGISFTKFQEPQKSSMASFLRKNLEVQSVISIENESFGENGRESPISPIPSTSRMPHLEDSPSPSPKKLKLVGIGLGTTKKRSFHEFYDDCESPSKLKVADLCLESVSCPPDADPDVFKELPGAMQKELWEDYKRERAIGQERVLCGSQVKKSKPNTVLNYFIRNN